MNWKLCADVVLRMSPIVSGVVQSMMGPGLVMHPLRFAVRVCDRSLNVTWGGNTGTDSPFGPVTSGLTTTLPVAFDCWLPFPPVADVAVNSAISREPPMRRFFDADA